LLLAETSERLATIEINDKIKRGMALYDGKLLTMAPVSE